jgi:UDP-N-acetylglucosamine--N-acetylmuramyl-(pentapeptide) pyrophosphoryl-undecaprenol N-acetylglucosamine transferase
MHIAFTGGGTGGHIFPILAVGEELRKIASSRGIPVRLWYIGPTRGPVDIDVSLFQSLGIEVREVAGSGATALRFIVGFFQSLWHLYFIMPDIIFSKGGYGAAPVIAAAIFYRIPFFIHESDAIPGKTNIFSARFAKRIAVSFNKAVEFFPKEKTAVVGNPIRSIFFEPVEKEAAVRRLGLETGRKTILIIGGSQGAKNLNEITLDILPELVKKYQVIHQCGARNFGEVEKEAAFALGELKKEYGKWYKLYGFISTENLRDAYQASDLVISRAGAGSIFEIAAAGKPAILIPFKFAKQNHQRANAYAYAQTGAALVLEEENLTPHIFLHQIEKILGDTELQRSMTEAARSFARPDAARLIAEELLRSIGIAI